MKKLSLLLIGLLLIPALFTSCDRGDDPDDGTTTVVVTTPEFTLMKEYMIDNGYDINKIIKNSDDEKFVVGPPADDGAALTAFLAKYYIMDIRSEAAYNTSHIQGANFVAFTDILTEAPNAGSKPILVVCFSGQTACYATALLRMYGYKHTQSLKWGMSGWNASTAGPWNGNIDTFADGHINWDGSDVAPTPQTFADPVIDTGLTDEDAILKQRVEEVVAAGFGPAQVSSEDVLTTPTDYHINNYFNEADYAGFGHIEGAYRILPLTLADDTYLGLDPAADAKVVTYCYTGQTSAVITACLRVLGYDAYTLMFGMNGMYNNNDAWTTNQWGVDSNPKNLPFGM